MIAAQNTAQGALVYLKGYTGKAGTVQRKKGAAPSPFAVQLSFQECSDGVYVKTQNHCLSC